MTVKDYAQDSLMKDRLLANIPYPHQRLKLVELIVFLHVPERILFMVSVPMQLRHTLTPLEMVIR